MTKIKMLNVFLEGIHLGVLQEDLFGDHTFTYDLSSPSNADTYALIPQRNSEFPLHNPTIVFSAAFRQ